ncbi:MAG: amino terminal protease family protein [Clostridiaceae bacterium]|jgi:membrane protease YdiL (CAAX protease family)|nr:amino terminal protease family protein [Clostridiaceae bacterium]
MINVRQKFSLFFLISILIIAFKLKLPSIIVNSILAYLMLIIFTIFVPFFKINRIIKNHIFYLPLYIPVFIIGLSPEVIEVNIKVFFIGIMFGLIMILINIKTFLYYLSNKNAMSSVYLDKKEFYYRVYLTLVSVIGEELFFRFFLLGKISMLTNYSILISTILFVYMHYLNRWAKDNFNAKIYILHFIVGLICATVFVLFKNILSCIIAHLLFNTPHIILQYKRTKVAKEAKLFDDYN